MQRQLWASIRVMFSTPSDITSFTISMNTGRIDNKKELYSSTVLRECITSTCSTSKFIRLSEESSSNKYCNFRKEEQFHLVPESMK